MLTQGKFPTYIDSFLAEFPLVFFLATHGSAFSLGWVSLVGAALMGAALMGATLEGTTSVIAFLLSSIDPDRTASKSSFAKS